MAVCVNSFLHGFCLCGGGGRGGKEGRRRRETGEKVVVEKTDAKMELMTMEERVWSREEKMTKRMLDKRRKRDPRSSPIHPPHAKRIPVISERFNVAWDFVSSVVIRQFR